jgi:hypothetical protein
LAAITEEDDKEFHDFPYSGTDNWHGYMEDNRCNTPFGFLQTSVLPEQLLACV